MGFQILWSVLIIFVIVRLFAQFHKKHITLFPFLFFLLAWGIVLFLNWNNALLNRLGHMLGIERGATILVYTALSILFYYVFISMMKFHKLEQEISRLVKKDAVGDFAKRYGIKNGDTTD